MNLANPIVLLYSLIANAAVLRCAITRKARDFGGPPFAQALIVDIVRNNFGSLKVTKKNYGNVEYILKKKMHKKKVQVTTKMSEFV